MSTILPFPKKRGRPRKPIIEKDFGTPELQMKRACSETTEALDLCLEKGLITQEQHWCGLHLRWLYTLRYGAPGVRAMDPNHISGTDIIDNPTWREAREAEYHAAIKKVTAYGSITMLMRVCIHNERPDFLSRSVARILKSGNELNELRDSLEVLTRWWRRKKQY